MTTTTALTAAPTSSAPTGAPQPAPVETMLAVLARISSHAGDPVSVTVTAPSRTIDVNVDDSAQYAAWRTGTGADLSSIVRGDELGTLTETSTDLYGWHLRVRVHNP